MGLAMPNIAISYRREDSYDITGRICDRLVTHFGRESIFRDIDSFKAGFDFRDQINATLQRCEVLLVVVGPGWLGHAGTGATRIASEGDFVRFEVEAALNKSIPVIPVLVGRAHMPDASELPQSIRSFVYRHAVTVSSGRDFEHHVAGLIDAIEDIFPVDRPDAAEKPDHPSGASGPADTGRIDPALKGPARQREAPAERATPVSADSAEPAPPTAKRPRDTAWRVVALILIGQALLALFLSAVYQSAAFNLWRTWSIAIALLSLLAGGAMLLNRRWSSAALLVACVFGLAFEGYWLTLGNFQFLRIELRFSTTLSFISFLLGIGLLIPRRPRRKAPRGPG